MHDCDKVLLGSAPLPYSCSEWSLVLTSQNVWSVHVSVGFSSCICVCLWEGGGEVGGQNRTCGHELLHSNRYQSIYKENRKYTCISLVQQLTVGGNKNGLICARPLYNYTPSNVKHEGLSRKETHPVFYFWVLEYWKFLLLQRFYYSVRSFRK